MGVFLGEGVESGGKGNVSYVCYVFKVLVGRLVCITITQILILFHFSAGYHPVRDETDSVRSGSNWGGGGGCGS